jgi:hypothetical protein
VDLERIREQLAQLASKIDTTAIVAAAQRIREALPPNWDALSDYDTQSR